MNVVRVVTIYSSFALVACVAERSEDPHGASHFLTSISPNAADYASAGVSGRGGAVATTPLQPMGASGTVAPPPPATVTAGTPGSVLPPTAMAGRAGSVAAPSGGVAGAPRAAAGSGVAGMAAAGTGGGSAAPTADHAGTLMVDFKSVTQGGTYAPQNVGAVWIETASGMFVKTLERWGSIRATHLTRWTMASGGWGSFFGGGNTADMMDAVSKATLRSHGAHHDTWDMKDTTGKVVPDGKYQVVIEVTEDNFQPGASAAVPFEKAAMPQNVNAPDMAPWAGLTLAYQP